MGSLDDLLRSMFMVGRNLEIAKAVHGRDPGWKLMPYTKAGGKIVCRYQWWRA